MILVCLDDTQPVTRQESSWNLWVGDGRNRFFDKHQSASASWFNIPVDDSDSLLLVIVFENGKSGFLGEHSCMDGTPTLRMNEFILASLAHGKVDLGPARAADTAKDLAAPQELKFVVDDKVASHITQSEAAFDKLVGDHELEVSPRSISF